MLDARATHRTVWFFDPLGHQMPRRLEDALANRLGRCSVEDGAAWTTGCAVSVDAPLQGDGHNCGVWCLVGVSWFSKFVQPLRASVVASSFADYVAGFDFVVRAPALLCARALLTLCGTPEVWVVVLHSSSEWPVPCVAVALTCVHTSGLERWLRRGTVSTSHAPVVRRGRRFRGACTDACFAPVRC